MSLSVEHSVHYIRYRDWSNYGEEYGLLLSSYLIRSTQAGTAALARAVYVPASLAHQRIFEDSPFLPCPNSVLISSIPTYA